LRILVPLALTVLGFTSTVAQLLLVRELVSVFYGNELLLGLILAAWMLWVALGARGLGRGLVEWRVERGIWPLALIMAGTAVLLPAYMAFIRRLPALLTPAHGVQVPLGTAALATAGVLMPLCIALGAQFALSTHWLQVAGGKVARAYLYESLGAVIGGTLFSLGLVRWLNPFQVALVVSAVNLAAGTMVILALRWRRYGCVFSLVVFLLLVLAALPCGHWLHWATLRAQYGPGLVYAADSPYGRLVVLARAGQYAFYENGVLSFETQSTHPEEMAHLSLLAHTSPRRVLLIGGVVAGDLREVLKHPATHVVAVELDAQMLEAAEVLAPTGAADAIKLAPWHDPRVTLVLDDGRRYVQASLTEDVPTEVSPLAKDLPTEVSSLAEGLPTEACGDTQALANGTRFDMIVLDVPPPATGALNRFYTLTFFEHVKARLRPGGVVALGLPSAENYWSPELARRNASVYRTLRQVFPYVMVLPGEMDLYLASSHPLSADIEVWRTRFKTRALETRWVTPAYLTYRLTGDRFVQAQHELTSVTSVRINRDLIPICYYYDLRLWLSRFYPHLQGLFAWIASIRLWWLLLPLLIGLGLVRWRPQLAPTFVVGGAGFAGMVMNVALLLAFQAQHGTLYQAVGVMVAAFMGGHTLGVWLGGCLTGQVRRTLLMIMLCGAMGAGVLAWALTLSLSLPLFLLLALLTGSVAGAVHPGALDPEAFRPARPRLVAPAASVASTTYAADLLGGCLGALMGGVILVPLLGVPQSCIAVALVFFAGALAIV
jgi:spermidine synthase